MTRGRTLLVAAALGLVAMVVPASAAAVPGPDEDAAARAVAEIQEAQDRANQAAEDYVEAQSAYEVLVDEAAALAAREAELQAQVDALGEQVEAVAVNRFLASGTDGIPLLTDFREPSEQLQADVLVGLATDASADVMDEYERLRTELEATQAEVAANQAELQEQQAEYQALQAEAEEQVETLQRVEEQRLEDERTYLAELARQREEARLREEQRQREEAAAAAAAAARAAEEQAAAAAAAALPAAPAPDGATAGAEAPASDGGGGDSGGSGGGGGSGYMVCPMAGSSSYADGWGNPRSGGRSHQGVDMMAPTGVPLVAVVSGTVQFKQNSLGGNAVWLRGDNGDAYYYAHLSSFEGSSRAVSQGEVIGYVGDTGNARGAPHLHFEVHPGGGAAVNPYPYVVAAGC